MMCLAAKVVVLPSASTVNVPLPASLPLPMNTATLFFLSRCATPDDNCLATPRERFTTAPMSNFILSALKP